MTVTLSDGLPLAYLEVEDHVSADGVQEGETFTLSIRLSAPVGVDVFVPLRTGPAYFSETTGLYFTSGNINDAGVSIRAGEILETRVIRAIDDLDTELDQVVRIEFDTSPFRDTGFREGQVGLGTPSFVDVTIPANDFQVQFDLSVTTINERGSARVYITGTGTRELRATFVVEPDSSADEGTDFTLTATTVTIPSPSGDPAFASLDIVGVSDDVDESDEVVVLRLATLEVKTGDDDFSTATFSALPSDTVMITISEAAEDLPVATLSVDDSLLSEGEETLVKVTLDVTSAIETMVTLRVTTVGVTTAGEPATFTGGAGDDIRFPQGLAVTIVAGATEGTLRLEALTDTSQELTEVFSVAIERISGVVEGVPSSVDVQISADPPTIDFQAVYETTALQVPEWGGVLDFLLSSSAPNTVLFVEAVASSTADYGAGEDYEFVAGEGVEIIEPVGTGNPRLKVTLTEGGVTGSFSIKSLIDDDYLEPTGFSTAERVVLRIVGVEVDGFSVGLPSDRERTVSFLESIVAVSVTSGGVGGTDFVEVRERGSGTVTFTLSSMLSDGTCVFPPENQLLYLYSSFEVEGEARDPFITAKLTYDPGSGIDDYDVIRGLAILSGGDDPIRAWATNSDFSFDPTDPAVSGTSATIEYDLSDAGDDVRRTVECSREVDIDFSTIGDGLTSQGTEALQIGITTSAFGVSFAPSEGAVHFKIRATIPALTLTLSPPSLPIAEDGGVATLSFTVNYRSAFTFTIGQIGGTATPPGEPNADYMLDQTEFTFGAMPTGSALREGSITITAVDDDVRESLTLLEDFQLGMTSGSVTVGGVAYMSIPITEEVGSTITLEIQDDEVPDVLLQTPATELVSWEDPARDSPVLDLGGPDLTGTSNQFTVVLGANPLPGVGVEICMTAGADSDGMVQGSPDPEAPDCLSFDETNWDTPQTVTMVSGNDAIDEGASDAEGRRSYMVNFDLSSSTDGGYSGFARPALTVIDIDDDTAGIVVLNSDGLVTFEDAGGAPAIFEVHLDSEPTDAVTITITSAMPGEGLLRILGVADDPVSALVLVFSPDGGSWLNGHRVEVLGQDDRVDDGNRMYQLLFSVDSADGLYTDTLVPDPPIQVTNTDDDTAGITVVDSDGNPVTTTLALVTFEDGSGTPATFTVRLDSEPTDAVTIKITSERSGEGLLFLSSGVAGDAVAELDLVFTSALASWSVGHEVTVLGQDDAVDDDDQTYELTFNVASSDALYVNPDRVPLPTPIQVTNTDDDMVGITVVDSDGLVTLEDGSGPAATFTVRLESEPTDAVTITITSSDSSEGMLSSPEVAAGAPATVLPLVFTPALASWSVGHVVTVLGQDDAVDDGDKMYDLTFIVASADALYGNAASVPVPTPIQVTNTDDDTAGISVLNSDGLVTLEDGSGSAATFTVRLDSEPTDAVTITITSSDSSEGMLSSPEVAAGAPATVLPLVFTSALASWSVGHVVTVLGQDDAVDDGDKMYDLTFIVASADALYGNAASVPVPTPIQVTNTDDDTAGISVLNSDGLVTLEDGSGPAATFTVRLDSEPTDAVTITITSSDSSEGMLSSPEVAAGAPATVLPLIFTTDVASWSVGHVVTVLGQDDAVDDGDKMYDLTFIVASADALYGNAASVSVPTPIQVTNTDDDTAVINISATSGEGSRLETREDGSSVSFNITLITEPTSDVVLTVTSDTPGEGVVSATGSPGSGTASISLTFAVASWSTPKMVYIQGVDDGDVDGDMEYTVTVAVTTHDTGDGYDGVSAQVVYVLNEDDETAPVPGFTIGPDTRGARLVTTEDGPGEVSFAVVLDAAPTGDVVLVVTSGLPDAGLVSATSSGTLTESIRLTFSTTNWSVAQNVYVTGVDDDIAVVGGLQEYVVTVAVDADATMDSRYDILPSQDVLLQNVDDDEAEIITDTGDANLTYESSLFPASELEVSLGSEPTAAVSITITTSSADEGKLSVDGSVPGSSVTLMFTPSNYEDEVEVEVHGINDDIDDDDQLYQLTFAVSTSDTVYNDSGLLPPAIDYVNVDDDEAAIGISPPSDKTSRLDTSEDGTSASFDITLETQPTSAVVLVVTSDSPGEGLVSTVSSSGSEATSIELTFALASWSTPKTVYILGVDDSNVDGDVEYTVTVEVDTDKTGDGDGYDGVSAQVVYVLNEDDETAPVPGLTISPEPDATSRLDTPEDGTSPASFTVVLDTQPTDAVVLTVTSLSPGDGLVSAVSSGGAASIMLNFDASDWSTPKTVYVLGVEDDLSGGCCL